MSEIKVICYNCGKVVNKSEAIYIYQWDCYYCPRCYLKLLAREPVKKTVWQKRGV